MNRKIDILYGALLISGAGLFQACEQEEPDGGIYGTDPLIAQGRYLTARSTDAYSLQDPSSEPHPFEVGTPYRLLAFSKPYDAAKPTEESPVAEHLRFNEVAWEGETAGNLRYINLNSEPDKWFGFSALAGETPGADGLVSLDFYGFTYGKPEQIKTDYISLDGSAGSLTALTREEVVDADGQLKDLMRGELLNQNIATAGIASTEADGFQTPKPNTQSVIPFRHCFSKLSFQVSQQAEEDEVDADGNPVPCFKDLIVEKIEVTGTYGTGVVSLADGKVNVSGDKIDRMLDFNDSFNKKVTVSNTAVGEMIIFPSDGAALSNTDLADGYSVGLKITVRSTNSTDLSNMLRNTGSDGSVKLVEQVNGVTWYEGTIVKNEIIDYYPHGTTTNRVLHFKQNTSYMLIIAFKKNSVRIITVIPMVEEWLPGEGTETEPWQDQALGHPQMFNNVIWSDRNLGADHYDPLGRNFEETVGYFYQAGRNIPYYPFNPNATDGTIKEDGTPDYSKKNEQDLPNADTSWGYDGASGSPYKFYPIVDSRILRMETSNWSFSPPGGEENYDKVRPQMFIPETMPTDTYYNFYRGIWNKDDMHWEDGQQNQPVAGAWILPSSKDFLSIFPSTPHAGNISFNRIGGQHWNPFDWGIRNDGNINDESYKITGTKIIRVTVPYYTKDLTGPKKSNALYEKAWNTLRDNQDDGTTHLECYDGYDPSNQNNSGEPGVSTGLEPDGGDPLDGFASVYVISFKDKDKYSLPENQKDKFQVKEWGTIYGIKCIYTPQAYRMRWRALVVKSTEETRNPSIYIEICRYRCKADDKLTEENFDDYDWEHPAATLYFPVCGLGDHTGQYINYGTECQYATSDPINGDGQTSSVQIKITGNNAANVYIAVVKGRSNRNFGMQIRPVMGG